MKHSSPSGRYLVSGPVAFDLKQKKGLCLQGDGDRKTIAIGSIRDDGTAYGGVQEDSVTSETEAVIAQVDLTTSTGSAKVLGLGTDVPPFTDVKGAGLFLARDGDENVRVSMRRER